MNKNIKYIFPLVIMVSLIIINCDKNNPTGSAGEVSGNFTDSRDNHTYNWQQIGTQTWMTENLAYKPDIGEYWTYNNDTSYVNVYGYLYSWETAQTIAPNGWHLPSQAEWQTLVDYLGGIDDAYSKLLEAGTFHWDAPNDATNESGFTALPSGYYDQRDNSFNFLGHLTMFHSSTESQSNNVFGMGLILNQNFEQANIEGRPKELALPVRLIKD